MMMQNPLALDMGATSVQYVGDNIGPVPNYTALGVLWFDTFTHCLRLYNGVEWEPVHFTKFSPAIAYRLDYSQDTNKNMIMKNYGSTETTNDLLLNSGRGIKLDATQYVDLPIHHTLGADEKTGGVGVANVSGNLTISDLGGGVYRVTNTGAGNFDVIKIFKDNTSAGMYQWNMSISNVTGAMNVRAIYGTGGSGTVSPFIINSATNLSLESTAQQNNTNNLFLYSTEGDVYQFDIHVTSIKEITNPNSYLTYFDLTAKEFVYIDNSLNTPSTTYRFTDGTYNNILTHKSEWDATDKSKIEANPNLIGKLALSGTGTIDELNKMLNVDDAWYDCMEKSGACLVDARSLENGTSYFISTDTAQVYTMKMPVGTSVTINGVEYAGNGNTNVVANVSDIGEISIEESIDGALTTFDCSANQLTGNIPDLSSNIALTTFSCHTNQLTGNIPDLSSNIALTTFSCHVNQLTGNIPDLSSNIALSYFYCHINQLTGNIPDLSSNIALINFYCSANQLTGNIPDLSSNIALINFYCNANQLTGFDGGTIKVTKAFHADNNALIQTAVDDILVALVNGGTTGATIRLEGSTNQAPSATGEAAIDTLRANGCTVTVTGGY
jgi:hypothetical protein